jgi:hypothetical protein
VKIYLYKNRTIRTLSLSAIKIEKISSITIFLPDQYNQEWEMRQVNKKDIANIRKQFKLDNHFMNIREIFNVYVKKESGEIYHQSVNHFNY